MIKGKGSDRLSNLGELGVLGANPIRGGEETRAKGAKDAKVKGMKDDEIAGGVVEGAFGLYWMTDDLPLYLLRILGGELLMDRNFTVH